MRRGSLECVRVKLSSMGSSKSSPATSVTITTLSYGKADGNHRCFSLRLVGTAVQQSITVPIAFHTGHKQSKNAAFYPTLLPWLSPRHVRTSVATNDSKTSGDMGLVITKRVAFLHRRRRDNVPSKSGFPLGIILR